MGPGGWGGGRAAAARLMQWEILLGAVCFQGGGGRGFQGEGQERTVEHPKHKLFKPQCLTVAESCTVRKLCTKNYTPTHPRTWLSSSACYWTSQSVFHSPNPHLQLHPSSPAAACCRHRRCWTSRLTSRPASTNYQPQSASGATSWHCWTQHAARLLLPPPLLLLEALVLMEEPLRQQQQLVVLLMGCACRVTCLRCWCSAPCSWSDSSTACRCVGSGRGIDCVPLQLRRLVRPDTPTGVLQTGVSRVDIESALSKRESPRNKNYSSTNPGCRFPYVAPSPECVLSVCLNLSYVLDAGAG